MSTWKIVDHLQNIYGEEISPDLISAATDGVLEETTAWRARPLDAAYPLVIFDALRMKVRDESLVRNKASTPPLACGRMEPRSCLASGLNRTKEPNSGCAS